MQLSAINALQYAGSYIFRPGIYVLMATWTKLISHYLLLIHSTFKHFPINTFLDSVIKIHNIPNKQSL